MHIFWADWRGKREHQDLVLSSVRQTHVIPAPQSLSVYPEVVVLNMGS